MKIDNRIKFMAMMMMGVALLMLAVFAISIADASTVLRALGVPANNGYVPAQANLADGDGWAIFGLGLGAGLALGLAAIGAGLGMGTASAASLGAITEKPETFGKSILYVVFIEAVAIYGFVIAFLLLGYIPTILHG